MLRTSNDTQAGCDEPEQLVKSASKDTGHATEVEGGNRAEGRPDADRQKLDVLRMARSLSQQAVRLRAAEFESASILVASVVLFELWYGVAR